ncbi:MAG: hypothetical protein LC117_10965 [Bacteroidia bacterium]|nr:hypothetical protein [Bacteroidia bacterium]
MPKKKLYSNAAAFIFIMVLASLIAVKINYFTEYQFKTSSVASVDGSMVENQIPVAGWLTNSLTQPSYSPELAGYLTELTKANHWNIEYYQPNLTGERIICNEIPFVVGYTIKSKSFDKQDFSILMENENTFKLTYSFGGIKRIRIVKGGQQVNEIELNIKIERNKNLLPFQKKDFNGKPVLVRIYSPQAYSEHLLAHHVSVESKNNTSTVITVNYSDPQKAKAIADALANKLASVSYESENQKLEKQLNKVVEQMGTLSVPLFSANQTQYPYNISHAQLISLVDKRNELKLRLSELDNLHHYLRQNRTDGNAVPEFGVLSDPVFAEYITSLNKLIHQIQNTQSQQEKQRLETEAEFLKNSLTEGLRNTRKSVALQLEETGRMIATVSNSGYLQQPEIKEEVSSVARDLAVKKYHLLLEKKALIIDRPDVISAQIPLRTDHPDEASVWIFALISGLLISGFIIRMRTRSTQAPVQAVISREPGEYSFAVIDYKKRVTPENQFAQWASDIKMLNSGKKTQIITICNSDKKSILIATNELAKQLTVLGNRVLLVDCEKDLKTFLKVFGLSQTLPLTDVLISDQELEASVSETSESRLSVVHLGANRMEFHPLFLVGKLDELICLTRENFDIILLVSPSVEDLMTLPLLRMSEIGFIAGENADNTSQAVHRWRTIFRLEHIYTTRIILPRSFKTSKKDKGTVRQIKNTQSGDEKISWLRKVALWFY